jgi:hypothetical protein
MTDADSARATIECSWRLAVVLGLAVVVSSTVAVLATVPAVGVGHDGGAPGANAAVPASGNAAVPASGNAAVPASGNAAVPASGNDSVAGESRSHGSGAAFATATRSIESDRVPPGGTTTVTLEIEIEEAVGKISIIEYFSLPTFESVGDVNVEFRGGSGTTAFTQPQPDSVSVGVMDVDVGTTVVVTYDVTAVDEEAYYDITGTVQADSETVEVTGDSQIAVDPDATSTTATTTSTTTTPTPTTSTTPPTTTTSTTTTPATTPSTTTTPPTTTTSERPGTFKGWWFSPVAPAAGERVTLVADGGGDATYEWDVDGDGTYEKTGETAVHTFETTGEHVVRLRVTGVENGPMTRERVIEVEGEVAATPSRRGPSFWVSPTDPLASERVTLVAEPAVPADSVASVRWDLDGDGRTETDGVFATHKFPSSGAYAVELQVERTNGETYTVERTVVVENGTADAITGGESTTSNDDVATGESTTQDDAVTSGGSTATPTAGSVDVNIDGETPGFGVLAGVLAVALALLLGHRRTAE